MTQHRANTLVPPDAAALPAGVSEILSQQHLSVACLKTLRAALNNISPVGDPQGWAATHLALGSAVRLRAQRACGHEQAEHYLEAIRAYEAAACVYCRFPPSDEGSPSDSEASDDDADNEDPVSLVLAAANSRIGDGVRLLSAAVHAFRAVRASPRHGNGLRSWAVNMSNLGCVLTLLGRHIHAEDGAAHLEDAVDAFREVLNQPGMRDMLAEFISVHVNLADALHALGERALPAERVLLLESAVDSLAIALSLVAPSGMRWMVEIQPSSLA
jgi:hypothetical protein